MRRCCWVKVRQGTRGGGGTPGMQLLAGQEEGVALLYASLLLGEGEGVCDEGGEREKKIIGR